MNAQSQARELVATLGKDRAWLNALETSRTAESPEHREFWLDVADHVCRIPDLVTWECRTCTCIFDSAYAAFLHRGVGEHHVCPIPGRKE